jgi:hypothetical protein
MPISRRNCLKTIAATTLLPGLRSPLFAADAPSPATRRTPALAEYERLRFGVSYHFSMNTFKGAGRINASSNRDYYVPEPPRLDNLDGNTNF